MNESLQAVKELATYLGGKLDLVATSTELQAVNGTLREILAKETPPFPEIPKPLPFPDMPVTDLTETNSLLSRLIERENETIDVNITLELQ